MEKSNTANCTLDISQIVSSCTFLLQHLQSCIFICFPYIGNRSGGSNGEERRPGTLPLFLCGGRRTENQQRSRGKVGRSRTSLFALFASSSRRRREAGRRRRRKKRNQERRGSSLRFLEAVPSKQPLSLSILCFLCYCSGDTERRNRSSSSIKGEKTKHSISLCSGLAPRKKRTTKGKKESPFGLPPPPPLSEHFLSHFHDCVGSRRAAGDCSSS